MTTLHTVVLFTCLLVGACAAEGDESAFEIGSPDPWENGHPTTHELDKPTEKSSSTKPDPKHTHE